MKTSQCQKQNYLDKIEQESSSNLINVKYKFWVITNLNLRYVNIDFIIDINQTPKDPVKDERTITIQRVLDQEKQFYKVRSLKKKKRYSYWKCRQQFLNKCMWHPDTLTWKS